MMQKSMSRLHTALDRLKEDSEAYPQSTHQLLHQLPQEKYKKPFSHNTTFVILIHLVKALVGPTILAMPFAFRQGGLVFSVFGFTTLTTLVSYNMKRLIKSAEVLSEREDILVRTYDDVAYVTFKTFSPKARSYAFCMKLLVNILFFITYLDACTIFMIFVGRSAEALMNFYYPGSFVDVYAFLFFQVIFLMSMCSIRDLKYIAPFSFVSMVLLFIASFLTVLFFFLNNIPDPSDRSHIGSVKEIISFTSINLFCLSGISISLTLKSSMKNPERFFFLKKSPGIYSVSLVLQGCIFVTFGFLGYLQYGSDTAASIMLNLPVDNVLSVCVKITVMCSVFLTTPLVFFVAFNVIYNNYIKAVFDPAYTTFSEFFIRYCLITISFIIAFSYPNLTTMIPLKGALFHSHLEVTIPALLDYMTFYSAEGNGRFKYRLIKAVIIISLGIFFCIGGVTVALLDIITEQNLVKD